MDYFLACRDVNSEKSTNDGRNSYTICKNGIVDTEKRLN